MNETTDSNRIVSLPRNKINYGRKRILLDYDKVTPENVREVLQKALNIHGSNKHDCEYLINYFLGEQDILFRDNPATSNINNKTVVNYALPITREIVGYTLGSPIELIAKNGSKRDAVQNVNNAYDYESLTTTDICTAIYASICGVGYYITLPSTEITKDNTPEIPLVIDYLDPRDTFIVQSNSVGNPQIMSCNIIRRRDGKRIYTCYTDEYKITIENMQTIKTEINPIGKDPITMLENSLFLTGDWEQAISVMNASNLIASDSLNDIEGTIRSLLVILGTEFQDGDDASLKKIKDNRLLTLNAPGGTNVDAKFIAPKLESVSVQNIREYLDDARNIITGIPDRENNGNGGDTGTAVLNRNGWTDIEIVARLKEMFIKKARKKQLEIGLKILKTLGLADKQLKVQDIDVIIGRHTTDNLSTKASAFATLVATQELATVDALELSGLTNRVNEMVERGKEAKEERQKLAIQFAKASADASGEGMTRESTGDNDTARIERLASQNMNTEGNVNNNKR